MKHELFNALEKLRRLRAGLPIDSRPEEIHWRTGEAATKGVIADWNDLPGDWRVWFEERAAIREFEGGQSREHAEAEALAETIRAMVQARSGAHHPAGTC